MNYFTKVNKYGNTTYVTICSMRKGILSIPLIVSMVLAFLLLSTLSVRAFNPNTNSYGLSIVAFVVIAIVLIIAFRDSLSIMLMEKGERTMINKLSKFIYQNHLYMRNQFNEIDYSIEMSFRFEDNRLVISLNALGTDFSKEIQEKEIALQSLFPMLRYVDKHTNADATEYYFVPESDNRIYVN